MENSSRDSDTWKKSLQTEAKQLRAQHGLAPGENLPSQKQDFSRKSRLKHIIKRLPVLGKVAEKIWQQLHLPQRIQELQARLDSNLGELHRDLKLHLGQLQQDVNNLAGRIETQEPSIKMLLHHNHQHTENIKALRGTTEFLAAEMRRAEAALALPALTPIAATAPSGAKTIALDGFYYRFEEHFRGSRASVRTRLAAYAPYVQAIKESPSASLGLLDIGCGRGEWLELLAEQGVPAIGIDLNRRMIQECRERGFKAELGDALDYLRNCGDASLAAVSAFHVVEHLEFPVLMQVLFEIARVLVPDGVVILETPNPENLLVGSYGFYTDPTHRNPLPPVTLNFMLAEVGFKHQDCLRMGTAGEAGTGAPDWERLKAAPDYAIIGYRSVPSQVHA